MKKGSFFRNVLDTIRSNQTNQAGGIGGSSSGSASARAGDLVSQLKESHFALAQVAQHGFPENPTALAFDPVQKICAIGTKSGALRVFGRPGVDIWAQHKPEFSVTHIKFIVNQGAIITVTSDDSIHLWSMRGPNLKLQLSSSSTSSSTSSSPAQPIPTGSSSQTSTFPATTGGSNTLSQQQSNVTTATSSQLNSQMAQHLLEQDSGAQPGDIDYLSPTDGLQGVVGGSSPTSDKNKLYASIQLQVLHTLKFQKERITYLHQTLMSKWLYIGTEKGNLHVVNVETFELSGYSIAWNKAIELSRKTHPGSIIHISECPQDSNKLLIGYETGCIVLWDLKNRNADGKYYHTDNLLWLSWHYEGKQFVASHGDGSLVTWQTRSNARPAQILNPHAKTATTSSATDQQHYHQDQQTLPNQQHSLASNFARALNNELYRPINKVEWKTSKNNEQFLLFSGGLPFDGLEQTSTNVQPHQDASTIRQSTVTSPSNFQNNQLQQQNSKTPSSISPASLVSPSPISPSISPSGLNDSNSNKKQQQQQQQQKSQHLRSTSLTVMYGKSITVLEMDDTIIDFITVCDSSPYENDASDPFAVIVLLADDFILLDLTSTGYPSFDSPYPSSTLSESPVTCVQYLADCSSDLIPFLYSTSQNVVSRAPKKGFSDKEWPINGGEWGQPMQSYPELVLTGHADGTIKFWDMSSVNFDLISKIKTSKLFERPNKLANSLIISAPNFQRQSKDNKQRNLSSKQVFNLQAGITSDSIDTTFSPSTSQTLQECLILSDQKPIENIFAIERIEYCSITKRLIVAGPLSQVIQFRLNKKESGQVVASSEVATILIEPQTSSINQQQQQQQSQSVNNNEKHRKQQQQHILLKPKSNPSITSASSQITQTASAAASKQRNRSNGFLPEIVCLTSLLVTPLQEESSSTPTMNSVTPTSILQAAAAANFSYCCQAAPKITALAFQSTHNILAYAHETGIVIVDIIQKCVILNATLADLYRGSSINTNTNRDISIQPAATSSILQQHHYQSGGGNSDFARRNQLQGEGGAVGASNNLDNFSETTSTNNTSAIPGTATTSTTIANTNTSCNNNNNNSSIDNESNGNSAKLRLSGEGELQNDNGVTSLHKTCATNEAGTNQNVGQAKQSRFTTNSMFQRQLSTTALGSSKQSSSSSNSSFGGGPSQRPFQRQATASQLFTSSGVLSNDDLSNKQRVAQLLASSGPSNQLASSTSNLSSRRSPLGDSEQVSGSSELHQAQAQQHQKQQQQQQQQQQKKPDKKKRIISRMLSISAIQTTISHSSTADNSSGTGTGIGAGSGSGMSQTNNNPNTALNAFSAINNSNPDTDSHHISDKVDSSFTRSRSSSGSSTTATGITQANSAADHTLGESVICLCFLDWTQASSSSANSSLQLANQQNSAQQQQQQQTSNAGTNSHSNQTAHNNNNNSASTSASAPNNKSPANSLDNSTNQQLALYLGTSQGYVLLVSLSMPDSEDNRVLHLQSVIAEPTPQASIKLPGSILTIASFTFDNVKQSGASTMTSGGHHSSPPSSLDNEPTGASQSSSSSSGVVLRNQSSSSFDSRLYNFITVVSEKQARVFQVPNVAVQNTTTTKSEQHHHHHKGHSSEKQIENKFIDQQLVKLLTNNANLFAKIDLSDTSYACRSGLIQMRQPDESCLVSYMATGNIVVHSMPKLKLLMDVDFVPCSSSLVSSSMCFSRNGHCLYRPSLSEICKFTISAQYKALLNDMIGLLHVPKDMPEMPRGNFFKSLFSVTSSAVSRQSDRDELFSECSAGKAQRGVAKHISGSASTTSGPSGFDKLKGAAAGTMGHDLRVAREGLDERGEKLGEIEDKTLLMMNQAESYSQAAHQLAQKFKDKKWYQF